MRPTEVRQPDQGRKVPWAWRVLGWLCGRRDHPLGVWRRVDLRPLAPFSWWTRGCACGNRLEYDGVVYHRSRQRA